MKSFGRVVGQVYVRIGTFIEHTDQVLFPIDMGEAMSQIW